jgi:hypothetical protein
MAPTIQGKTSTDTFKMGFTYTVEQFSSDYEYSYVTITPYLCNTKGVVRYQHQWTVEFHITEAEVGVQSLNYNGPGAGNFLPNRFANADVERLGYMMMQANVWYQWGSASPKIKVKNDGKSRFIGIKMQCPGVAPKYCPAKDTYLYTPTAVAFPQYTVQPDAHSNLEGQYNPDTRTITYSWDVPSPSKTASRILYRTFYDSDGKRLAQGFVTVDGVSSYSETLTGKYADVASVDWYMTNYSSTGYELNSDTITTLTPSETKVWIRPTPESALVKAIPWVKTPDGVWHKATKSYVRPTGDDWHILIT